MEQYIRIAVIVLTIHNFLAAFILPMIRGRVKYGVKPVSFKQADSIQALIGKVYFISLFLIFFSAASFGLSLSIYKYFVPITIMENNLLQSFGLILNIISIIWIIIGQKQMEETWRIGIFDRESNRLVTSGLFRFSRHPIMLGLIGLMLSTFLCMPNCITFTIFVVSLVLINIEAFLEEKELKSKHGDSYIDYCNKTRRWL